MVDLNDIKGIITVGHLFDDNVTLYIVQIDRRGEKLQHSYHCTPLPHGLTRGGKIVSTVYFVVNIMELSSETWYTIVNDRPARLVIV